MSARSVAIVGGGFSGSLFALQLLSEAGGPDVTLIERSGTLGLGAAYATTNPEHLLNTRAGNMSALPEQQDHFLTWLRSQPGYETSTRETFAPRAVYGAYITSLLDKATSDPAVSGRLTIVAGDAVCVRRDAQGMSVDLASGDTLRADAVALALGNLQPATPPVRDPAVLDSPRYVPESWRVDIAQTVGPDDAVFLIGTGLTMVDVVVALSARGHRGPLFALSRRGLVPRAHIDPPPGMLAQPIVTKSLARSIGPLRSLSTSAKDWRSIFDGLRPVTAKIWSELSLAERGRFLRHARPYWDVHRHRLAPRVAEHVAGMRASGQLKIAAGRLIDIVRAGDSFEAVWRPRGDGATQTAPADWIINCIGPHADITKAGEPILESLMVGGLARPDPLKLGMEVDAHSRIVGADGVSHPDLVAVGPLTRSAFWETTAVPDIRNQAADTAKALGTYLRGLQANEPASLMGAGI